MSKNKVTTLAKVNEEIDLSQICLAEAPKDVASLRSQFSNAILEIKRSVLRSAWYVGRYVQAMKDLGQYEQAKKDVIDSGMSERSMQESVQFYQAFPEYTTIASLAASGVTFSIAREIARLDAPEQREELVEKVTSGDIQPEQVKAVVQELYAEAHPDDERSAKKKKKGEEAPLPGGDPEPVEPKKFFAKLEGQVSHDIDVYSDFHCEILNHLNVIDDENRVSDAAFKDIIKKMELFVEKGKVLRDWIEKCEQTLIDYSTSAKDPTA